MDSLDTWRQDLEVPDAEQTTRLRNAVKFTKQEIDILFEPMGINSTFLKPFIMESGDPRLLEENPVGNPLFMRPLVRVDDKIIVALPGSMMCALRHFIWVVSQR